MLRSTSFLLTPSINRNTKFIIPPPAQKSRALRPEIVEISTSFPQAKIRKTHQLLRNSSHFTCILFHLWYNTNKVMVNHSRSYLPVSILVEYRTYQISVYPRNISFQSMNPDLTDPILIYLLFKSTFN